MDKILEGESLPQDWLDKCLEIFPRRAEGESLEGIVVQVDKEFAYLDVGMKSEGVLSLSEFDETPKIGDTVSCILVQQEGKNGGIVLSKRRAELKLILKNLNEAFENKLPVKGKFTKVIKGGFEISLGSGLTAFLPISRADIYRIENPDTYIDLTTQFYLNRLHDHGKISPVVDRRSYLETISNQAKEKFFRTAEVGDTVEGIVKNFANFGAFIDLGGFDGLLHLNDMSWSRVVRPRDYVIKDQKINLKIIRIDHENKRVNLGLKHLQKDPWIDFEKRYKINDIIEGEITKITNFGVFVQIEEGIEGLVHISELSWVERIKHPKEILSIGEQVKVCVLGYDTSEQRISLGLKQTMDNPWDSIAEKYPVGLKISGKVKKVTAVGAFITLEKGIDAFLHINDSSWEKRIRNFLDTYSVGSSVDSVIISVNSVERRINLGVKQLQFNPWDEMLALKKQGKSVETEIVSKTDFGVFVKVPNGLEGLIHRSHLTDDKDNSFLERIQIGDKITALILTVLPEKHRLSLSVRDYERTKQEKELGEYFNHNTKEDSSYTLAEAFSKERV